MNIRGVKASDLGSHFTHLCDRRLKLTFSVDEEVDYFFAGVAAPPAREQPAGALIMDRGVAFESLLTSHLSALARAPGSPLAFKSYTRFGKMEDLENDLRGDVLSHCRGHPGRLFVIHEPLLDPVTLAYVDPNAHAFFRMFPDFLFLFWDPVRNRMACVVVDAKSSRAEKLQHKAQVVVYQLMLRALLQRNADLHNAYDVPAIGGVWVPETQHSWLFPMPPGFPVPGPSLFNCDLVQAGLEAFLGRILRTVNLNAPAQLWRDLVVAADWRVNGRCSGCEHLPRCTVMAGSGRDARVTSLPHLTDAEAAALSGIVSPTATVQDVEDLLRQRPHGPAAPLLRSLVPPALVGALTSGLPAARAGRHSVSFPRVGVRWGLAVSSYQNPCVTRPEAYTWAVRIVSLESGSGREDMELECGWIASNSGGAQHDTRSFADAGDLSRALVRALWRRFEWLATSSPDNSAVILFTSRAERALVGGILFDLGLSDDDAELSQMAKDLFLSMTDGSSSIEFGGANVLGLEGGEGSAASSSGGRCGDPDAAVEDRRRKLDAEKRDRALERPRVVVIDETARDMLHLPSMRGLYTAEGVLTALTGEADPPCFDATMVAWREGRDLGDQFGALFSCAKAAVGRIHQILAGNALLFSAGVLEFVDPLRYAHKGLSKLAFVAQWESYSSWRRVFVPRATLPLADQLQAGIATKLVLRSAWRIVDGHLQADFQIHEDSRGTRLEAVKSNGGAPHYNSNLLVLEGAPNWEQTVRRYVDIGKSTWGASGPMSLCACSHVDPSNPNLVTLTLQSKSRPALRGNSFDTAGAVFFMFPRFVDMTLNFSLESLSAWDRRGRPPPSSPPADDEDWNPLHFPDLVSDGASKHLGRRDNRFTVYPASGGRWSFAGPSEVNNNDDNGYLEDSDSDSVVATTTFVSKLDALLATGSGLGLVGSQLEGLRKLALTRFMCLWGPAGSGKTHTLARMILTLAAHTQGFRVCAVSSTHNAVDTLLETLVELDRKGSTNGQPRVVVGKLVSKGYGERYEAGGQPEFRVRNVAVDQLARFWSFGAGRLSVVGGTVWKGSRCVTNAAERQGFDLVIVDEASQMPLSHASIAHELVDQRHGRLVIAGDHKQLPPVMVGDYPAVPRGSIDFSGSYLETVVNHLTAPAETQAEGPHAAAAVFADQTAPAPPSDLLCVAKLRENWRMNGAHARLCAQLTYGPDYCARPDNEVMVISAPSEEALACVAPASLAEAVRAALNPAPEAAITSLTLEVPAASLSRVAAMTPAEAASLEAHVAVQIAKAFVHSDPSLMSSVLIITPHHVQRRAVNALLEEHGLSAVLADVVEKMQGKTSKLTIACLCSFQGLTEGTGSEGPSGGRSHFFLERQRLNVALTRAQCKTVVLTTQSVVRFGLDALRDPNTEDGIRFFLSAMASIPMEHRLSAQVADNSLREDRGRKRKVEVEFED
jgi:hypothetical protein